MNWQRIYTFLTATSRGILGYYHSRLGLIAAALFVIFGLIGRYIDASLIVVITCGVCLVFFIIDTVVASLARLRK